MIRARFIVSDEDYRPILWPPPGPYWCSGTTANDDNIVIAYAADIYEILEFWPDAQDIDDEQVDDYVFTSRFPKPEWWTE